jgi:hypothetical protein
LKLNNIGFNKSLTLVSSLIKDLDEKMNKIRETRVKSKIFDFEKYPSLSSLTNL